MAADPRAADAAAPPSDVRSNVSHQPSSRRSPVARPQFISVGDVSLSSSSTASTPLSTPRKDSSVAPSPSISKRSSFIDSSSLRQYSSPQRSQRTHSFSGQALAELLMNPANKAAAAAADDERFRGRDWRAVQVHEIIDPDETRFVELDSTVEHTTKLLIRSGAPNVVLVRDSPASRTALTTFDYSDLNAYLLLVLGLSQPDDEAARIAERARSGGTVLVRHVQHHLGAREEPVFLPHTATLAQAVEALGGGHHRVIVTRDRSDEAVGVLSQLRLVGFFWQNHHNFAATATLYPLTLRDLDTGAKDVLAINGDRPLADALRLMHSHGITSLPVLDQNRNVVGNISHVDVRLLTDTASIPLLSGTCIHFISVILSERGMLDGKDAYPVFHVTPHSTLAHTVAKLCATRSHRMWVVDSPSPSTSVPPSPGPHAAVPPFSSPPTPGIPPAALHHSPITTPARQGFMTEPMTPGPPFTSINPAVSVSAAALPGANMSGRLCGVVSLTDILNLFARASGLHPADPEETRRRRRQSSSASSTLRPSLDGTRPSLDALRPVDLGRSSSRSSERRFR